ncbi:protein 4.1 isoform X1 [Synchiropus splendidus]|uniref:protein 4.1 isoform X1 n=2 Tax=Synchiropus splendidus TaxID=270530 RepID=UPI00237E40EF|nr:protein 4.1 isoform X1 [Synchiropus splendidus]
MTTDDTQSHQNKPSQQERGVQNASLSSPEENELCPHNSNSTGRGLSRLLSAFLKRRSQCECNAADNFLKNGEEDAKAPIADLDPDLNAEGEVALDWHSVHGGDAKPLKEDMQDVEQLEKRTENDVERTKPEEFEKKDVEKKQEEKVDTPDATKGEKGEEMMDGKTPTAPRRPKTVQIKVTLLDNTLYECELEKHAKGQELFLKVCDHLNLLENDYYGLVYWESSSIMTWMDVTKEIRRQVQGANYNFTFKVKFYPPDPAQLSEDITRYYLCLQLRKDILQSRLPCSFATLALLGSYALQSEVGEYDPEVHGPEYARELKMAPGPTKELEEKMIELHRTYRSMSPAQADLMFLENAKKLSMYGVDLHQAKDLDGVEIMLGVCSSGLMVYKDKLRINRFPWPKVLKVSYKRSGFFIKIRPSQVEEYECAIGFKLPNYKAAKKLWKVCVEHHTFFRLNSTEIATTPRRFLALGSKFRYSGRTQTQTRQASSLIDRPAPMFHRTSAKRDSNSLDGDMISTPDNKSSRPVSAPLISPVSPVDMTPPALLRSLLRPRQHDLTATKRLSSSNIRNESKEERRPILSPKKHSPQLSSTPDMRTQVRKESRHTPLTSTNKGEREKKDKNKASKLEGETIYIRHSNLMLEDMDKTQTEILRHHTSISELKRSFMESLPEPQPNEWDKRLSTSSPFRTANINGQLQQVSPALKTQRITISDITNSLRGTVASKEAPLLHTETKTITYESAQPIDNQEDKESGVLCAQTITSETISTTTTTQITKTVKGGISETRIEKRIIITGDTEIDHDKALAQAIKEAKEQHPDMSVTKVVVHQETEISPEQLFSL